MGWKDYNLITFGCSHTYGHGLPDSIAEDMQSPGVRPSNWAWPARLQQQVQFNSVSNQAKSGSSNKMIAKAIIEYPKFTKQSIVVILWANFNRATFFKNKKERLHMLPHMYDSDRLPKSFWIWHGGEKSELQQKVKIYYEDFYEEFDAKFDQMIRINYIHAFLKNKGVKSFHLIPEHELKNNKDYFNKFNLDNLNIKTFNWRKDFNIDYALDVPHPHPGLKSHSLFADNIKGWFFK